jgi:DnaK suppressor protein
MLQGWTRLIDFIRGFAPLYFLKNRVDSELHSVLHVGLIQNSKKIRRIQIMEIERYRQQLLAKEQEVLDSLRRRGVSHREQIDPGVLDTIDESIFLQDKESLFAQTDRDTHILREIQNALERIEDGSYGHCLEDGEPIREARLNAIPWASYCVAHQAGRDGALHNQVPVAGNTWTLVAGWLPYWFGTSPTRTDCNTFGRLQPMRWKIRKSFRIFAPGSSLRKRVAYSLAIVRLILVPVIFLSVYYLFAMGRIVDRIVNVDAPAAKLAEQASIEILEARRAARNYILLPDPEYLRANQESLANVRQMLVHIGDIEPDEEPTVQKGLDAANRYQQQFAAAVSMIAASRQKPDERVRKEVRAYEKDLEALVKAARHKKQTQLIQELRTRVGSFDTQIAEAIQAANPTLHQVTPDLRASSEETLELTSDMEKQNWEHVERDHQEARQLIFRAEWSLSIVSAVTLLFSVWVSFILPRQVAKPLVSLKDAVDHAATGNYEIDFELHGGGEVVELAKSVQHLTSLLRRNA